MLWSKLISPASILVTVGGNLSQTACRDLVSTPTQIYSTTLLLLQKNLLSVCCIHFQWPESHGFPHYNATSIRSLFPILHHYSGAKFDFIVDDTSQMAPCFVRVLQWHVMEIFVFFPQFPRRQHRELRSKHWDAYPLPGCNKTFQRHGMVGYCRLTRGWPVFDRRLCNPNGGHLLGFHTVHEQCLLVLKTSQGRNDPHTSMSKWDYSEKKNDYLYLIY